MTVFTLPARQGAPEARVDHLRSWSLRRLTSRCTVEGVQAGDRFDPFYDGLWEDGSSAVWTNRELAARQDRAGFTKMPKRMLMTEQKALASLWSGRYRAEKLRLLAALDSWRTLTCEQAAAMAGTTTLLDVQSTIPRTMWNLNLVDVGQFRGIAGRGFTRRGWLYRPTRSTAFDDLIVPNLSWPEWVSVTAGMPFNAGGQFDRHNVLATELGLRALEFADVGTVLGEKLSRAELLCSHMPQSLLPKGETKAADLTIVRPDGLRIAVEITASATSTFAAKAERWAKLLDEAPLAESGLVVVFVVAKGAGLPMSASQHRAEDEFAPMRTGVEARAQAQAIHDHNKVRSTVAKRIAAAVRNYPGQVGDRVADRMFLASWQEWFPARGRLGADFLSMRTVSPSGPVGDLWQERHLLGEGAMPFRPRDPEAVTAVLANAQALAGVPVWARHPGDAPDPAELLMERAGRSEIPAAPSTSGLAVGEGQGAVGPTGLPERLRWV